MNKLRPPVNGEAAVSVFGQAGCMSRKTQVLRRGGLRPGIAAGDCGAGIAAGDCGRGLRREATSTVQGINIAYGRKK